MAKVLIVDDDPAIRDVLRFALARAGFEVVEAGDGRLALERFAAVAPDLVVLDVMLPGIDGIEVCRALRRESAVPILFLSSKEDEIDRVVGLEIGGDDYIGKPFSPRELVARVKALLRRAAAPAPAPPRSPAPKQLRHGKLTLDLDFVRALWDGHEVALTATEFGILRTLLARPGKVYSRDDLMSGAYGIDKVVSDRTIDSHMRRLRAKFAAIGAAPVETLHGFGYKLSPCA
ncbi:MAG TPA: response regulator transcription factor [Stellaceae bacterium]|nr:response regulator transcription factor [Stellaceae bacterium]